MSQDTVTGQTIAGRYTITGYLRSGRMGDIYVARRVDDNERVAVKLLDPALFDQPEAISRFERETAVTRELRHPCTMKVVDHGKTDQGAPWMVLEYVEGELLSDVIEEGPLKPERAARLAGQVAMALGEAHEVGVVHRDLQPQNILVARIGGHEQVKVREFGLSRLQTQDDQTNLTAVGVRIGTPYYMAPEYIEEFELDHRADLYSLGVVLFEMLTGEPPYQGRPYKVMDLHMTAEIPLPSSKAPDVPGWLDDLVVQLMAKDPAHRPQQAAEVVAAVERGLGGSIAVEVAEAKPTTPQKPARPAPRVPELDPILVNLIQKHTISLKVVKGPPPDPEHCLLVERVAQSSLAANAGVRPGMFLELPEEPVKGLRDSRLYHPVVRERRYVFATAAGDRLDLVTTGLPIGVDVIRAAEHVRASYDPLTSHPSALLDLYKQQDWEALERLSWKTLTQQRGSGGVFSRLLGGERMKLRDHPALVMWAVARIEGGKPGGPELLQEYRSKYAPNHAAAYDAIAALYQGRDAARRGDTRQAADLLWHAYVQWPQEGTAIQLENLVKRRPEHRAWFGRAFPEYSMDTVDRSSGAKLSDTLQRMGTDQLLAVCLLGGFRGNADYDAFMHRYLSMGAWFHEVLFDLHVVTTEPRRQADQPGWYKGEDLVIGAGLRFKLLEDYLAYVQRSVKPAAIPTVYLIDKQGIVVHEGQLSEADLWEALALAGRRRLENLRGA